MKVSKGQSQPEIVAEFRLLNSLHGSGFTIFVPGFDCGSLVGLPFFVAEKLRGEVPQVNSGAESDSFPAWQGEAGS